MKWFSKLQICQVNKSQNPKLSWHQLFHALWEKLTSFPWVLLYNLPQPKGQLATLLSFSHNIRCFNSDSHLPQVHHILLHPQAGSRSGKLWGNGFVFVLLQNLHPSPMIFNPSGHCTLAAKGPGSISGGGLSRELEKLCQN